MRRTLGFNDGGGLGLVDGAGFDSEAVGSGLVP